MSERMCATQRFLHVVSWKRDADPELPRSWMTHIDSNAKVTRTPTMGNKYCAYRLLILRCKGKIPIKGSQTQYLNAETSSI